MNSPVKFQGPAALQVSPTLTMTLGVLALVILWAVANNKAGLFWQYATRSGGA